MDYLKFKTIKEKADNYFGKRITSQIIFAKELCLYNNLDETSLDNCVDFVYSEYEKQGAITSSICSQAEEVLSYYKPYAKQITALMVAHAHIDMNWLWGYNETVNITLSTCRTMLELMKEYEGFTFSQSQASVYRIIEEHDPEMLNEIRERVKQGRWEVSSTTWVENDKNMPDGESQVKQYTFAKSYLSKLLDLDESKMCIDFEPDTFGHNANQPEIMRKCGVKYYYHCRGNFAPVLYNWQSPSGSKVLVYREPSWYNWNIEYDVFSGFPKLAKEYGINKILKVYGVGDHGGGATRRDLDRIVDMMSWPIAPNIKFSSYSEFFSQFDVENNNYQTITGEINYIFSGCYTSQTRIKKSNRRGEKQLKRVEELGAVCEYLNVAEINNEKLSKAWEIQLFNHFHDILPGSGVLETSEYALGQSQKRDTYIGVEKTRLLKKLAESIDTSSLGENCKEEQLSFGAGVGFTTQDLVYACGERAEKDKVFLIYNPTEYSGKQIAELVLWDYYALPEEISVYCDGEKLEMELVDAQLLEYWGHKFRRIKVAINLSAKGYKCVVVKREIRYQQVTFPPFSDRQHNATEFILENEYVRAHINRHDSSLLSLYDKVYGRELLVGKGCFVYVKEDVAQGMNAWITGLHRKEKELTEDVSVVSGSYKKDVLTQSVSFKIKFENSLLNLKYVLSKYSPILEIQAECDFMEIGNPAYVPALEYRLKTDTSNGCNYGIPFGIVHRNEIDDDQVGIKIVSTAGDTAVALMSDSKYGYRANNGNFSVNLIRSTTEPSLAAENYKHTFKLGISSVVGLTESEIIKLGNMFDQTPEVIETYFHKGGLRTSCKWINFEGKALISSIKRVNRNSLSVVAYGAEDGVNDLKIDFDRKIKQASLSNFLNEEISKLIVKNNSINIRLNKGEVVNIIVEF